MAEFDDDNGEVDGGADEGVPPVGSVAPPVTPMKSTFIARVASASKTQHTEAIALAVCRHPNVLSYRGLVEPDRLRINQEFRAAFKKYKGMIPGDDDAGGDAGVSHGSGSETGSSRREDIAAIRSVDRRKYPHWYFKCVLVTPYCSGHSLHDALASDGPYGRGGVGGRIGEARLLVAARSIAKGMKYLHEQNLVHNDLKPKNILCVTQGIYRNF